MENDLSVTKFFKNFLKGFKLFFIITLLILVSSAAILLSIENKYLAYAKLAPVNDANQPQSPNLGAFSGIAGLAGINIGGSKLENDVYAVELMNSRSFFKSIVDKYDILPDIIATKKFDQSAMKSIYDARIYNPDTNQWNRERLEGKEHPSMQKSYEVFKKMFEVSRIRKFYCHNLCSSESPVFARNLINLVIEEINLRVKQRDVAEDERFIDFMTRKAEETVDIEARKVFYELIGKKYQELALKSSREYFVFNIIEEPVIAEEKYYPSRLLYLVLISFSCLVIYSSLLMSLMYFGYNVFNSNKSNTGIKIEKK